MGTGGVSAGELDGPTGRVGSRWSASSCGVFTKAFSDYHRTTVLYDETDPNRLHDLQADLDGAQVCSPDQVREFVKRYLDGAERGRLDPILDRCVAAYIKDLNEDGQVRFKGQGQGIRAPTRSCPRSSPPATWAGRSVRFS